MYRTDKQFMTNPATAPSRIYIGFLAKTVVASDLEEKFKAHGKILGLVQQQGFAFIQYESAMQAQAAIQKENFSMLHGRKITVKQALDKGQKGNQGGNQMNQKGPNQNQNQNFNQKPKGGGPPPPLQNQGKKPFGGQQEPVRPSQQQQKPPPLQQQQQQQSTPQQQQQKPQQFPEKTPPPQQQLSFQPPLNDDKSSLPVKGGSILPMKGNDDMKGDGPPEKRGRKRRMRSRDRFQGPGEWSRDESGFYGAPPTTQPYNSNVMDQPDRNDCEIIVVSKPLTKYAEYIEQRLKGLGLIVDLLFPNEDVPIGRVLANISSRGCLYAILIMPQNEEHRSLTLNILHGIPQEHRNMPIEDALVLITRNFDAYMRGDKTASEIIGPGGVMSISDRHPTPIQLLLNLLAENRQITSSQYDRLVKYLQDRREIQHQHEIDEGIDQESQESNSKQAELQSRIMNILNKTATDSGPLIGLGTAVGVGAGSGGSVVGTIVNQPQITPSAGGGIAPPPLLKDPTVQKALDSLLGGEMFKNISGGLG